jgi:hypothetical protein
MHPGLRIGVALIAVLVCSASCARIASEIDDVKVLSLAIVQPQPTATQSGESSSEQLEVEFESGNDLYEFASRTGFNLAGEVRSCDSKTRPDVLVGGDYVRSDGIIVGSESSDQPPPSSNASHPFRYTIQVPLRHSAITSGPLRSAAFDLRRRSMQLCLRLRGGDMSGGEFESKVAMIPKSMLDKVLQRSK